MRVESTLTFGWPLAVSGGTSNAHLTASAVVEAGMLPSGDSVVIDRCESAFRRRAGGFSRWKKLVQLVNASSATVECRFDVFAYQFLAVAKNLDLLWPLRAAAPFANVRFADAYNSWREQVRQLEQFESTGIRLDHQTLESQYLHAREILARRSCRDERRVVLVLLTNGPSQTDELALDLGLSSELCRRVVLSLQQSGCVQQADGGVVTIVESSLPACYFLLRETLGYTLHGNVGGRKVA